MRRRTYRRAMLALLLATGPLGTACEIAFDFDRTPLQPIYEAGTSVDGRTEGPGPTVPRDGGRDATSTQDAQQDTGPADTGSDGDI